MTLDQLRQAASQRCFVRWFPSGKVERLRLAWAKHLPGEQVVLAENLITSREHPIRPFRGQTEFWCTVISPQTPVCVGDLLPG